MSVVITGKAQPSKNPRVTGEAPQKPRVSRRRGKAQNHSPPDNGEIAELLSREAENASHFVQRAFIAPLAAHFCGRKRLRLS
jgi:hypothetical protein